MTRAVWSSSRTDADDEAGAVAELVEDLGRDAQAHAAALGEDGDLPGVEDARVVAADRADLHPLDGVDDPDRRGADDAHAVVLGALDDLGGVPSRQALGQDVDEPDGSRGDGLEGRVAGRLAGDRNQAGVGLGVGQDGLGDGVVDGHAVEGHAALAGGDAGDDVGAVVGHLAAELGALLAGDALDDEAGVAADEEAHSGVLALAAACRLAWRTTMRAESATEVAMPRRNRL